MERGGPRQPRVDQVGHFVGQGSLCAGGWPSLHVLFHVGMLTPADDAKLVIVRDFAKKIF